MPKKRGRPMKEYSKIDRVTIRMGRNEKDMLAYLTKKTGISVSDIVRNGIRMTYNLEKSKE